MIIPGTINVETTPIDFQGSRNAVAQGAWVVFYGDCVPLKLVKEHMTGMPISHI